MKPLIRRSKMRHVIIRLLYSGEGIRWDSEQGYHAPGGHKLTPLALETLYLFAEHEMVGVTRSGWAVTTPAGTDLSDSWPQRVPEDVEWFIKPEEETVDTPKLPEARLILSGLDGTPLYLVFKTEKGWVGAPGLRKGRFLTDEDVKDGIPYVPAPQSKGPRIGVDIRFKRVMHRVSNDNDMVERWVSSGGHGILDDDEVVELTEHESITLTNKNVLEVGEFLGAEECTPSINGDEFDEVAYIVEAGSGISTELVINLGTQIWRTRNVFYVRQPGFHYFQLLTRRERR